MVKSGDDDDDDDDDEDNLTPFYCSALHKSIYYPW